MINIWSGWREYMSFILFAVFIVVIFILQQRKRRRIPSVSFLPDFLGWIPILDPLYTFYRVRKGGTQAYSEWISKLQGKLKPMYLMYPGPWPFTFFLITDVSLSHKVLSSSNPGHLNKPQIIYGLVFADWLKDGLLNADHDIWLGHRKGMNKSFTFGSLQSYLKIMDRRSKDLVRSKLYSLTVEEGGDALVKGKKMFEAFGSYAIETISEIILGTGFDIGKEANEFLRHYHTFRDCNLYRVYRPYLHPNFLWRLHPKGKKQKEASKETEKFIMKIINLNVSELSKDSQDEGKCLIEGMLKCGFSHKEIYYEVGTALLAGHESTETSINMLLFDLASHPEHQDLCRKEVDQIFENEQLNTDFDLNVTMEHLSNLKYLERCIMESMRISPTVPVIMRTINTPLQHENSTLEVGDQVMIPIWLLHRNPQVYPNPEKFDPDRFLPEAIKKREPGAYIPFSEGPRKCIGWKSAIMQMKTEMLWLLRHFTIHTTDRRSDVKMNIGFLLQPDRNYNVILKWRKQL